MPQDIQREQISFQSNDGESTVSALVWWPEGMGPDAAGEHASPVAVIQLVHGMEEHIQRYDGFARYLAARGFVVAGHDQLGHGRTTPPRHWGELPLRNGARILVEDIDRLREVVQGRVGRDVPYFLFGHSMGSFEVRSYISRHAEGLSGAIICGTGYVPPAAGRLAERLSWASSFFGGEDRRSRLLDALIMGPHKSSVDKPRTDQDWLSYNRDNVDAYIADPACGFPFASSGYAVLGALTAEANSAECAARVPHDLPLLYVSGGDDPVGGMGEGVRRAAALARDAGSEDVTVTIYGNMRHEILNEDDRERVYDDIIDWVRAHLTAPAGTEA